MKNSRIPSSPDMRPSGMSEISTADAAYEKRPSRTAAAKKRTVSELSAKVADGLATMAKVVGKEVEANFQAWYKRNFLNHRAGRIGTESYDRAGAFDDCPGYATWYADALERSILDYRGKMTRDEFNYIISHPLIAFQMAVGITDIYGLRCLRRGLSRRINSLQQKAYRSRYYDRDNERRRKLAAERRKIRRRTTTNPCPTPEAFREAFARVKESVAAKVYFGGMVQDLECYVDNCLRFDGSGDIIGRNGGIRAWIDWNVPELKGRYKTIMRYKALAKRLRQLAELHDPEPTDILLAQDAADSPEVEKNEISGDQTIINEDEISKEKAKLSEDDGNKNYYAVNSQITKTVGASAGDGGNENYYAVNSHQVIANRTNETNGTNGANETNGTNGVNGTIGKDGKDGANGRTGTSGISGGNGASGSKHTDSGKIKTSQEVVTIRREMTATQQKARNILTTCENTLAALFRQVDEALG